MGYRFEQARILVVDDEEANVRLLQRVLGRAGLTEITSTTDARQALPLFLEIQPDLVLLDLMMPHLDGFEVMDQFQIHIPIETYLPILILTADATQEIKWRSLANGGTDFLTKPFDAAEVLLRVKNLLETRFLHLQIVSQNEILQQTVRERTRELEQTQFEILERLAIACEFRDDETGEHTRRVGVLSTVLGKGMGLPDERLELLRLAAPLHDVGKIGVPDTILLKPGKLSPGEFERVRTHADIGARILSGGQFPLLQMAEMIAQTHHERWNGLGYPRRLTGEEIPLPGRIVAVADVFDALTHERPYKEAWPLEQAVAEIREQSGHQFDPNVVRVFLEVHEDLDYLETGAA